MKGGEELLTKSIHIGTTERATMGPSHFIVRKAQVFKSPR